MPIILVKIGEEPPKELQLPDERFTVLTHKQGTRVDIPDFLQINGANTLLTVNELKQNQWEHISTGPIFQDLFYTVFPKDSADTKGDSIAVAIPKDVNNLKEGDLGVSHVAGMIIMMVEEAFKVMEGKKKELKIFFRNLSHIYIHQHNKQ